MSIRVYIVSVYEYIGCSKEVYMSIRVHVVSVYEHTCACSKGQSCCKCQI